MTKCSVVNCSNQSIAKELCNAHYLRQRRGKNMETPVQEYNPTKTCIECGENTNGKGGFLRCQKHYTVYKRKELKAKLIEKLGGKCEMCNGIYPSSVFDFHHIDNKLEDISSMFTNKSENAILEEVKKCMLLCANCHRIFHYEK